MSFRPPKKTLLLWQLRLMAILVVFIAVTSWLWVFAKYLTYIIITAAFIAGLLAFVYLPKYVKTYSITLRQKALIIKSGVFITHERIMPFPRLLYTEQLQTPLAASFGLSALLLKATRSAVVVIEINKADIEKIIEAIS